MIIQINDDIIKLKDKSIVIFDEETRTFKTITTDELLGEIRAEIKTHKSEFEALQTQLIKLQDAELIENFKALKSHVDNDELKAKLVNYMAYQLLLNDINKGEIDEPANIEFIERWINKQTADVPDVLRKYVKSIKGE